MWPTKQSLETTDASPDDNDDDEDEDDDIEAMISKERAKIREEHAYSDGLSGQRGARSNKPKRRIGTCELVRITETRTPSRSDTLYGYTMRSVRLWVSSVTEHSQFSL